jgi:hypothetical protein
MHGVMLAAGLGPLFLNPELPVRFDHPSDLLQNALTAIVPFHVPDLARDIAWNKPFPYSFHKTTYGESYHENHRRESGISTREAETPFAFDEEVYPGGWTDLTTHLTRDFALGSAAVPYVNGGHADSVMLRVRCGPAVGDMADFRSIWSRGVYNGAEPGRPNYCHTARTPVDASYLYEEGRPLTYQHENHVIVCYSPKRAGHRDVTSFRIDLQCTAHRQLGEVLVGGKALATLPARFPADNRILLRDPYTYILLQPLPLVPAGGPAPLVIRRVDEFLIFSLYNYEGEATTFSRAEIGAWRSGFYLAVYSADEFGSWEDFCSFAGQVTVIENVSPAGVRTVSVHTGSGVMEFANDPRREQILTRTWNGHEERTTYFDVSAAGATKGRWCPRTLFGREGFH